MAKALRVEVRAELPALDTSLDSHNAEVAFTVAKVFEHWQATVRDSVERLSEAITTVDIGPTMRDAKIARQLMFDWAEVLLCVVERCYSRASLAASLSSATSSSSDPPELSVSIVGECARSAEILLRLAIFHQDNLPLDTKTSGGYEGAKAFGRLMGSPMTFDAPPFPLIFPRAMRLLAPHDIPVLSMSLKDYSAIKEHLDWAMSRDAGKARRRRAASRVTSDYLAGPLLRTAFVADFIRRSKRHRVDRQRQGVGSDLCKLGKMVRGAEEGADPEECVRQALSSAPTALRSEEATLLAQLVAITFADKLAIFYFMHTQKSEARSLRLPLESLEDGRLAAALCPGRPGPPSISDRLVDPVAYQKESLMINGAADCYLVPPWFFTSHGALHYRCTTKSPRFAYSTREPVMSSSQSSRGHCAGTATCIAALRSAFSGGSRSSASGLELFAVKALERLEEALSILPEIRAEARRLLASISGSDLQHLRADGDVLTLDFSPGRSKLTFRPVIGIDSWAQHPQQVVRFRASAAGRPPLSAHFKAHLARELVPLKGPERERAISGVMRESRLRCAFKPGWWMIGYKKSRRSLTASCGPRVKGEHDAAFAELASALIDCVGDQWEDHVTGREDPLTHEAATAEGQAEYEVRSSAACLLARGLQPRAKPASARTRC